MVTPIIYPPYNYVGSPISLGKGQSLSEALAKFDPVLETVRSYRNVVLFDNSQIVSYSCLFNVLEHVNMDLSNQTAIYWSLDKIKSLNDFIDLLVNAILFISAEDDAEMLTISMEYLPNYEKDMYFRYDGDEIIPYIHLFLGEKPLESAKELIQICDQICIDVDKCIVLCFDKIDSIFTIKKDEERNSILSLFRSDLWQMKNINVVAAIETESHYSQLTSELTPYQYLCFDFTLSPLESDNGDTKRKRGRPKGSKNKKSKIQDTANDQTQLLSSQEVELSKDVVPEEQTGITEE